MITLIVRVCPVNLQAQPGVSVTSAKTYKSNEQVSENLGKILPLEEPAAT